jgi:adenine-specific DNA methylase
MWNHWLNEKVNYEDELVISEAANRKKDINNYRDILGKTVKQLVRVLKPNKYLTFIFHTHDYRAWDELLGILKKSGLKIYDISTMNYSHHSLVQHHKEGGLKYDFVLTFRKANRY